ncbi:hypothetical protein CRM22_002036 [Opisthorchis felineus]|uniref:WGR domain-containing protein n=1 Tax=Opisthorchis felineus TaxID=147828 RepID=A0A4S2M7X3_OPIFE|nr:hypothetical protein CRM22_002036 [Opisthorchis felineus]
MPPKRKVASAVKTPVKQAKTEGDTDEKLALKKKLSALKKVDDKKTHKVDKNFCVAGDITCRIHEDYDCTLNQTDVKNNNNKFYIIQLIVLEGNPVRYVVWTRWGRVVSPHSFRFFPRLSLVSGRNRTVSHPWSVRSTRTGHKVVREKIYRQNCEQMGRASEF